MTVGALAAASEATVVPQDPAPITATRACRAIAPPPLARWLVAVASIPVQPSGCSTWALDSRPFPDPIVRSAMKAAVIYENGGPGVLRYADVADPDLPAGCVVIHVHAVKI